MLAWFLGAPCKAVSGEARDDAGSDWFRAEGRLAIGGVSSEARGFREAAEGHKA
jgi:hypothetical protein